MTITLTEAATTRVKTFMEANNAGVRLAVKSTGCSGYAYVVEYTDSINDDDIVYEQSGIKIIVKQDNLPYIDGMEIDYGKEGLNENFMFKNPNAKATCGCGESFSI